MVRVTESKPLPSEKERGLLNYLWEQVNKSISIFIFRFKKKKHFEFWLSHIEMRFAGPRYGANISNLSDDGCDIAVGLRSLRFPHSRTR